MKISLSPFRGPSRIEVSRDGDTVTINDELFDFSSITDGASLPSEAISGEYFSGTVDRVSGELEMTIRVPHGALAPVEILFPEDIIDPPNGLILIPPYELEVVDPDEFKAGGPNE